jgi:hypothetical protein
MSPRKFIYTVVVTTDTPEHAAIVINERINFDERYFVTPDGESISPDDAGPNDTEIEYWVEIDWDYPTGTTP